MICEVCKKDKAPLILNACADCDPELHKAWDAAVRSSTDFETVTPEMEAAFEILNDRKINGRGKENPVGFPISGAGL